MELKMAAKTIRKMSKKTAITLTHDYSSFRVNMEAQIQTLNIHEWKKVLCLKALNESATILQASIELGVTERTIYHYINTFNIKKDGLGRWHCETKKQIA